MKSNINKWIKISALLMFFFFTLFVANQAQASVKENVFGSAWSENIGWVSFNNCPNPSTSTGCTTYDYGVSVDKSTLEVKGHAWSDNLGWISFNPGSDWNNECPPGVSKPCTNFKNKWGKGGWARVVSVSTEEALVKAQNRTSNAGGYDGWISLGGTNFSASFDTTKNVASSMPSAYQGKYVYTIDSSDNGYWWGSEVMGWIDLKPTSSYDPSNGGVFLLDLSTETLDLTPNPSSGTVLAGDKIDIHWEVKGFIPTTCTGTMFDSSNNPISGRADWNKTFNTSSNTSGDIIGIEVPYDSSNANPVATKFTLSCADSVKTVDNSVTITAEVLDVFMRDYFGGACVSGPASTFDWSTNDTTPSCQIDATPASGGSSAYTIPISGTPPTYDLDFRKNYGNGATKYSFSCQNGINNKYQSPVKATTTGSVSIKQCIADYSITYDPSCQPFVLNSVLGIYEATAELSATSMHGFAEDITLSDGGGIGSWTFNPKGPFTSPYNSKIDATLSMSQVEYDSIDWKKPFTRDILADAIGFYQRTQPIKFCELGGKTGVKPKYKPF
jgi:hypothetical protein